MPPTSKPSPADYQWLLDALEPHFDFVCIHESELFGGALQLQVVRAGDTAGWWLEGTVDHQTHNLNARFDDGTMSVEDLVNGLERALVWQNGP